MNSFVLSVSNPGIFAPKVSDFDIFQWWPFCVPFLALIVVGLIVMQLTDRAEKLVYLMFTVSMVGLVAFIMVIPIIQMENESSAVRASNAKAQHTYSGELVAWLDANYGITATADEAVRMVAGESFTTSVDGKLVNVTIGRVLGAKLAVMNVVDRVPLPELPQR